MKDSINLFEQYPEKEWSRILETFGMDYLVEKARSILSKYTIQGWPCGNSRANFLYLLTHLPKTLSLLEKGPFHEEKDFPDDLKFLSGGEFYLPEDYLLASIKGKKWDLSHSFLQRFEDLDNLQIAYTLAEHLIGGGSSPEITLFIQKLTEKWRSRSFNLKKILEHYIVKESLERNLSDRKIFSSLPVDLLNIVFEYNPFAVWDLLLLRLGIGKFSKLILRHIIRIVPDYPLDSTDFPNGYFSGYYDAEIRFLDLLCFSLRGKETVDLFINHPPREDDIFKEDFYHHVSIFVTYYKVEITLDNLIPFIGACEWDIIAKTMKKDFHAIRKHRNFDSILPIYHEACLKIVETYLIWGKSCGINTVLSLLIDIGQELGENIPIPLLKEIRSAVE